MLSWSQTSWPCSNASIVNWAVSLAPVSGHFHASSPSRTRGPWRAARLPCTPFWCLIPRMCVTLLEVGPSGWPSSFPVLSPHFRISSAQERCWELSDQCGGRFLGADQLLCPLRPASCAGSRAAVTGPSGPGGRGQVPGGLGQGCSPWRSDVLPTFGTGSQNL